MRCGDSGSEATRSIGKARSVGGIAAAWDQHLRTTVRPQLDHFPQERQAGAAQGKGLVQFQIAAGGDLLGHRPSPAAPNCRHKKLSCDAVYRGATRPSPELSGQGGIVSGDFFKGWRHVGLFYRRG